MVLANKYFIKMKLRSKVSQPVAFFALDRRPEDQFIAAFPRSGQTWLRTMLTNVLRPSAESDPDVFNTMIPGVTIRRMGELRTMPSPRLLSTHSCWREEIERAVYLVRDGRDSLVSFYHYNITRRGRTEGFEEFFQLYLKRTFGKLWHENVESWLVEGKSKMGKNLHVVRFDKMKKETEEVLVEICSFLGLSEDSELKRRAIELASLKNMREIEARRKGKVEKNDVSFYRGGKSGGWREYFTTRIEKEFLRRSAYALHLAGYDI